MEENYEQANISRQNNRSHGRSLESIAIGTQTDNNTFCHLANLYRGKQQKNGFNPVQINDWIDTEVLKAAK